MTFRAPADLIKRIEKFAAANEVPRSEALRQLVESALPAKD
ncbi:metal-responsive CopG/Arc/MetJ family transcriptional regulator [Sphingobium sp. B7D2B]|nr:ribbon-helix-helix protein, CopG family [Sphingobium sp. B7D2B]MCW2366604.1 metal-responsive CopG/Arc/MetJ family transcriptional regulator [Sphingobium sp. B7D2B]